MHDKLKLLPTYHQNRILDIQYVAPYSCNKTHFQERWRIMGQGQYSAASTTLGAGNFHTTTSNEKARSRDVNKATEYKAKAINISPRPGQGHTL